MTCHWHAHHLCQASITARPGFPEAAQQQGMAVCLSQPLGPCGVQYAADDSFMNSSRRRILNSDLQMSNKSNFEDLQWTASLQDTACLADETIQCRSQAIC